MPCMSATNCGVSSKNCTSCFCLGPPPTRHEMVQEISRVDRLHSGEVGINSYRIYLNLNTYLSLWLRVQLYSNELVKDQQNCDLQLIMWFLNLPNQYYHLVIEKNFQNPTSTTNQLGCETQCLYCNGAYKNICPQISKSQLTALLTTKLFHNGPVSAASLIGMISSKENYQIK